MADKAGAHRAIVHFEMILRVPGERRDAIAELQPQGRERAREAVAAFSQRGVADAARFRCDDLAITEPLGSVIEEFIDSESVRLHERV